MRGMRCSTRFRTVARESLGATSAPRPLSSLSVIHSICFQVRQLTGTHSRLHSRLNPLLPHEELSVKGLQNLKRKSSSKTSVNTARKTTADLVSTHQDLSSYLKYHNARLSLLKEEPEKLIAANQSYVHLGTRYEYLVQEQLASVLGFSLTRIGGKGDGGVDLIGTWSPPKTADGKPSGFTSKFRVFLQAKRYAAQRKPSPNVMREIEGTLRSAADTRQLRVAFKEHLIRVNDIDLLDDLSDNSDTCAGVSGHMTDGVEDEVSTPLQDLGILVTTRPLTDGIVKAMANSRQCLMYMQIDEYPFETPISITTRTASRQQKSTNEPKVLSSLESNQDQGGNHKTYPSSLWQGPPKTCIRQLAWNQPVTHAGLQGYSVIVKVNPTQRGDGAFDDQVATLAYQGASIQPNSK